MTSMFLLLLCGVLAGSGLTALAATLMIRRRQRAQLEFLQLHIKRQVSRAVGPVFVTATKLAEIVAQIQEGQGKQHDQIHKLAEFALQMKKDMAAITARQLAEYDYESEDEADFATDTGERPRLLN